MYRQVSNLTSGNSRLSRYFRADVLHVGGILEAKSKARGFDQGRGI